MASPARFDAQTCHLDGEGAANRISDFTRMSRGRLILACFVAVSAAALSGCYADENHAAGSAAANGAATGPRYPGGVLASDAGTADLKGVFPAVSSDDPCCWVAPDVTFRVLSDDRATTAHLTVYEPKLGPFVNQQQTLTILDASGKAVTSRDVGIGASTVDLPLPRGSVVHRTATIRLHMSRGFVPKDIGLNSDPRTLSIILQSADAR